MKAALPAALFLAGLAFAPAVAFAQGCPEANVRAHPVVQVPPVVPKGLTGAAAAGTVYVRIDLDESSKITQASIYKSDNSALNRSALDAARASQFQTEIVNCKAVARSYLYIVRFVLATPRPTVTQ